MKKQRPDIIMETQTDLQIDKQTEGLRESQIDSWTDR